MKSNEIKVVLILAKMDKEKAARLLNKWIHFYGMEDPGAWDPIDYPYIEKACKAMKSAILVMQGMGLTEKESIQDTINRLEEWPTVHIMDDPEVWETLDFPFVRNALNAIHFSATYLKEQQMKR